METQERSASGFVQNRLPWLVAVAVLAVFGLTVNRWLRLDSLYVVAKVTGWDWTAPLSAPLHFLVTYPFRLLPVAVQPVALNLFSALLGAVAVGLLARCVALLPYDRTREARLRVKGEFALLHVALAWLPPVFAAGVCALQLTFWEHAAAATHEMLDLVLFAFVVRCLIEARLSEDDGWLYRLAFVYGLAVTNNYAMIGFFPFALAAVVWVKGFEFFNWGFLGRMTACGVAGLLAYLILPLAAVATETDQGAGFWGFLKAMMITQKNSLLKTVPPFIPLLLSLTSLVPVLLMSIRWPTGEGDTSRAGHAAREFITLFMHVAMLAASLSIFFDPPWSPRGLGGGGIAFLPFHFLAALAVGYYTGYLLLVFGEAPRRPAPRGSGGALLLGRGMLAILLMLAAGSIGYLTYRNLPTIVSRNGTQLGAFADRLAQTLPPANAYVVSDHQNLLLLTQAALERRGAGAGNVYLASRLLSFPAYHSQLGRIHGTRWPFAQQFTNAAVDLGGTELSRMMDQLATTGTVHYLHPSMGYYFESVELQPRGLTYRLASSPENSPARLGMSNADLDRNQQYWKELIPFLDALRPLNDVSVTEERLVNRLLAGALNHWGTTLMRAGRVPDAERWFQTALRLVPANLAARASLQHIAELRAGKPTAPAEVPALDLKKEQRGFDQVLLQDGPFDYPPLNFRLGLTYSQGSLFRQAHDEFLRLRALFPNDKQVEVWEKSMEVMTLFGMGQAAEAERRAMALRDQFPNEDVALEPLTQIYLNTQRFADAVANLDAQLRLNPDNPRALLNRAAISIRLEDFAGALPALNTLLGKQPENTAALLNRAIVHLRLNNLDAAQADYEILLKTVPGHYAVYFGLGEIAQRRNDKAAAIAHYESYLKYGNKESNEYKQVQERIRQLGKGGA